jgi:hypothetical protein
MKNIECRVASKGSTYKEIMEDIKIQIQQFLEITAEEFEEVYKKLELKVHVEKASAETHAYWADATFVINISE